MSHDININFVFALKNLMQLNITCIPNPRLPMIHESTEAYIKGNLITWVMYPLVTVNNFSFFESEIRPLGVYSNSVNKQQTGVNNVSLTGT